MVCGDEAGPRRAGVPLGVQRKALSRFLNRGQAPFHGLHYGVGEGTFGEIKRSCCVIWISHQHILS